MQMRDGGDNLVVLGAVTLLSAGAVAFISQYQHPTERARMHHSPG